MPMARSHPILTACALALLLPSAAHAGPIEWEVSAHFARVGAATGSMAQLLTDEYIGGGTTIHEQTFSRLVAADPARGWGWKSVRVGSVVPDGYRLDPLHSAPGTFDIALSITDIRSGASGTLAFTATGWEVLVQDIDNPFSGILRSRTSHAIVTGTTEESVILGGVEYHVGLRVEERADEAELVADIRAGDVAATPEPTTLVLAGLGLGVAGLARRRSGLHATTARG
jgi:hypothetical protein